MGPHGIAEVDPDQHEVEQVGVDVGGQHEEGRDQGVGPLTGMERVVSCRYGLWPVERAILAEWHDATRATRIVR